MKTPQTVNKTSIIKLLPRIAGGLLLSFTCVALSACRGAPCSTCGGYAQPGYGTGYPNQWQQPYVPNGQTPGVVLPQGVYPQGNTQPGFYGPGTVPIAPQQGQPGSSFGG